MKQVVEPLLVATILSIVRYIVLSGKRYPNAYFLFFTLVFSITYFYKRNLKLALLSAIVMLCLRLCYRSVVFPLSDNIKNNGLHFSNNCVFFIGIFSVVYYLKNY